MSYKAGKPEAPRMPDATEPDRCIAHGCPLRATIFDTVSGPRTGGRCRYHEGIAPKFWPQLTEALNRGDVPAFEVMGLKWTEPTVTVKHAHRTRSGHLVSGPVTFAEWFERFKTAAPTVCPPQIGSFTHAGAMLRIEAPQDFEAAEERRAIQAEGS